MLRNAQTTCTDTECFTGQCERERWFDWLIRLFCSVI